MKTTEFNTDNLVKYNSKVVNKCHADKIISTLYDYVDTVDDDNYTIEDAKKELFVNNKDIEYQDEDGSNSAITNYYKIEASTLDIYYDCWTGVDDVDRINGDFAYKLVHDDAIDKKAMSDRFEAIRNELDNYRNDEYLNETFGDNDIDRVKALYAEVGGDITQIEQSSHDSNEFSIGNDTYLVLLDDEATEKAIESINNYIDDCLLGSIDEQLRETITRYFDDKGFIEDCLSEGRGLQLAGYDSDERTQIINGVVYYIYRTN